MKTLQDLISEALIDPPDLLSLYGEFYSPYYNLMRLLSSTFDNGTFIELGVHKGRGIACLASGNKSNLVYGLDTVFCPELQSVIDSYSNIVFLQIPSLPAFNPDKKINILHVDTEHSYAMAKAEFEAYLPYLAKGAYVLFDDLHAQDDGVLSYFNELPYFKIQEDKLHPICGYGIVVYE